jgi:hypothetical protein
MWRQPEVRRKGNYGVLALQNLNTVLGETRVISAL